MSEINKSSLEAYKQSIEDISDSESNDAKEEESEAVENTEKTVDGAGDRPLQKETVKDDDAIIEVDLTDGDSQDKNGAVTSEEKTEVDEIITENLDTKETMEKVVDLTKASTNKTKDEAGRNGKPIEEEPSLSSIKRKHEFSDDEEKDDDSHPDKKINTSDE